MPPYRVILAPRAVSDLDQISAHIAKDSPQNAVKVIESLRAAMHSLRDLPGRYRVHDHRKDPVMSAHSMPVPPYVVYCRLNTAGRTMRVLTVYHGRRKRPR